MDGLSYGGGVGDIFYRQTAFDGIFPLLLFEGKRLQKELKTLA